VEYTNILLNGGVINNVVICLASAIIFSKWRVVSYYWSGFNLFFSIITFFVIFVYVNNLYL
jgi:hypothetical protein